MRVADLMRTNLPAITPETTSMHAAQAMRDANVGFLPIVADEASRRVVGVLTDRDLCLRILADALDPRDTPVGDVMSQPVVAIGPNEDLAEAERRMVEAEIRRLPVVDDAGALLGVVSLHDVAQREGSARLGEVFREVAKPSAQF